MVKPVELFGDIENANGMGNGTMINNWTGHIAIRERYVTEKATKFKIKDWGIATLFVGLKITRDCENQTIYVDQAHYAREILDTYGMKECNLVNVAITLGKVLRLEGVLLELAEKGTYQANGTGVHVTGRALVRS